MHAALSRFAEAHFGAIAILIVGAYAAVVTAAVATAVGAVLA